MRYSRSHRRHHHERLRAKRLKESFRWSMSPTMALKNAQWRVHTACLCSCSMCGNPRRHYGNAKQAKSFQELKTPIEFE
jgi:ribonuclease I